MPTTNPYKEALKEPANLMGIAGLVAASAALLNPIPVLAAVVLEAAYLLFVPETQWYKNRLSERGQTPSDLANKSKREEILPTLRQDLQDRYLRLEQTRTQIEAKVRSQVSFRPEIFDKLDRLLTQFLDFAVSEQDFRSYLSDLLQQFGISPSMARDAPTPRGYVPPRIQTASHQAKYSFDNPAYSTGQSAPTQGADGTKWIGWAVNQIQSRFNSDLNSLNPEAETDPSLKELKSKRADVVSRRSDHVARLGKAIVNLDLQLQLIEDTFGLINDEIRSRNPDQVVGEIDNLMMQTDSLSKSLQELGSVESIRVGA